MFVEDLAFISRPNWARPTELGKTQLSLLGPVRPEAVSPDRALCLPTFSHLLIVDKLLSLSSVIYLIVNKLLSLYIYILGGP